jgi:ABC-type transport system involved in cytochrome bd biosynthesis fused ATPase/permease subunit
VVDKSSDWYVKLVTPPIRFGTDIVQALARALYYRQKLMVFDDILSAIDAKTEALVVERLFGKTGILKQLGSTTILATHAGEYEVTVQRLGD